MCPVHAKVLDTEIGRVSYKSLTSKVLCYSEFHAMCDLQATKDYSVIFQYIYIYIGLSIRIYIFCILNRHDKCRQRFVTLASCTHILIISDDSTFTFTFTFIIT